MPVTYGPDSPLCLDCNRAARHEPDCLTLAVEEGRMTPRQRQVIRHETKQVDTTIHDAISEVGANGGRIERIIVGTGAFDRLMRTVPNGSALNSRLDRTGVKYMGYDLVVDDRVPPNEVYVTRKLEPPALSGWSWLDEKPPLTWARMVP